MVRAFFPQAGNISIVANTSYPPQDFVADQSDGVVPGIDAEIFEDPSGTFGGIKFDDDSGTGFVLVKEV